VALGKRRRRYFEQSDVTPAEELKLEWKLPDVDELVQVVPAHFLSAIEGNPYSEDRVRNGAEKLAKFLNTEQQGRLDGFFTVHPETLPNRKIMLRERGREGRFEEVCFIYRTTIEKRAGTTWRTLAACYIY